GMAQESGGFRGAKPARRASSWSRKKALHFAARRVTALAALVGLVIVAIAGCEDTLDSRGRSEAAGPQEAVGEATQASSPVVCVELKRAGALKAFDTQITTE